MILIYSLAKGLAHSVLAEACVLREEKFGARALDSPKHTAHGPPLGCTLRTEPLAVYDYLEATRPSSFLFLYTKVFYYILVGIPKHIPDQDHFLTSHLDSRFFQPKL